MEPVGREAHNIRASSVNIGAKKMEGIARALERVAGLGDPTSAAQVVPRLISEFDRVRTFFDDRLDSLNS